MMCKEHYAVQERPDLEQRFHSGKMNSNFSGNDLKHFGFLFLAFLRRHQSNQAAHSAEKD
jgi:hypothetical protein